MCKLWQEVGQKETNWPRRSSRRASGGETRWAGGQAAVGPALEEDNEEARMTAGMQTVTFRMDNQQGPWGTVFSIL